MFRFQNNVLHWFADGPAPACCLLVRPSERVGVVTSEVAATSARAGLASSDTATGGPMFGRLLFPCWTEAVRLRCVKAPTWRIAPGRGVALDGC